jgi:hypothetical protein
MLGKAQQWGPVPMTESEDDVTPVYPIFAGRVICHVTSRCSRQFVL